MATKEGDLLKKNLLDKGVTAKDAEKITSDTPKGLDLANGLAPAVKDRFKEDRSIYIKMSADTHKKPEVTFIGYWNGKFIKAAFNAVQRTYRSRRHRVIGRV